MEADSLARIRAEIINDRDIPTVPLVLTRILQLVSSESTTTRELIEVIEADQVLTGRILRVANSAFFGRPQQVATLSRAVLVLGFRSVRDLALGVKVWEAFLERGQSTPVTRLWEHAAVVAVSARSLATALRIPEAGLAFTAGILHDLGRAILYLRRPDLADELALLGEAQCLEAEMEHFGVEHTTVGGWLGEAWQFPDAIVGAVRDHHQQLPEGVHPRTTTELVHIADQLAQRLPELTMVSDEDWPSRAEADGLLGGLGLPDQTISQGTELLDQIRVQSLDFQRLFRGES